MYVEAHDSIDVGSDHRVILLLTSDSWLETHKKGHQTERGCVPPECIVRGTRVQRRLSDAVTTHEIKEKYSEIGGRLIGDEV